MKMIRTGYCSATSEKNTDAGWSSSVARRAHNPKVVSSNLAPATNYLFSWLGLYRSGETKTQADTARQLAGKVRQRTDNSDAGWSSSVARRAHNPKVVSSNLAPATNHLFSWLGLYRSGETKTQAATARQLAGKVRQRTHNSDAGWSSSVARRAHNPKVVGSNPAPATNLFSFLLPVSLPILPCITLIQHINLCGGDP